jgi:hypothetical protein
MKLLEYFLFVALLIVVFFVSAITHEKDLYYHFEQYGFAKGIAYNFKCK